MTIDPSLKTLNMLKRRINQHNYKRYLLHCSDTTHVIG